MGRKHTRNGRDEIRAAKQWDGDPERVSPEQGQPPQMGIIPETEAILSCTFSSVIWGWQGQRTVLTYTAQRVKTGARFSAMMIIPLTSAQLKKVFCFVFFSFRADLAQSLL